MTEYLSRMTWIEKRYTSNGRIYTMIAGKETPIKKMENYWFNKFVR